MPPVIIVLLPKYPPVGHHHIFWDAVKLSCNKNDVGIIILLHCILLFTKTAEENPMGLLSARVVLISWDVYVEANDFTVTTDWGEVELHTDEDGSFNPSEFQYNLL